MWSKKKKIKIYYSIEKQILYKYNIGILVTISFIFIMGVLYHLGLVSQLLSKKMLFV